ncbi:polysaccharide deacetylase family protein [Acuticoccus sp.]|uniref:polysaccharide deacetylase family protein n=1 Tax=Acuticoccus sp. TaxID=1904378 RepID=UPI003B523340
MGTLRSHGRYPYSPLVDRPVYDWPGGKRLAVSVVNNVEVFAFLEGLGSDSAVLGAPQSQRNYAWRDYGNRVGVWYLFDLLDELEVPAAHNVNSLMFEEHARIGERILERGDHFLGHGRTNSERQDGMGEDEERALIGEATEAVVRFSGQHPRGWLGPWIAESERTPDLLKEAGYDFVLDWPADDQPFWMSTRAGPLMSVPYSVELNDSPALVSRQEGARDFEAMIVDQFDEMLHQSRARPLVFSLVLHTFIVGQPYRLRALRRALTHVMNHRDEVWLARPAEIYDHAKEQPIP